MATKITTGLIANDAITSAHIGATAITHADLHTNMDLTGKTVLVANASTGDNDTTAANTAFVQQELAALVDSAPGALNTLNELAAALGDDANFSTTVTNSIATKLPLAGGTMSGSLNMGTQNITNAGTITSGAISSTGTIEQYDTYNDASKFLGNKLVADAGSTSFNHPYLDMRRWTGVSGNHYVASIELSPENADGNAIVFMHDTKTSNTKATTERGRFDSSGRFLAGKDAVGARSAHTLARTGAFAAEILQQQTSAGASVLGLTYDGVAPNNTTDYFIYAIDNVGIKYRLHSDGSSIQSGGITAGASTFNGTVNLASGTVSLRGDVALDHDGSSLYIKAPSAIYLYPNNTNRGNIASTGALTLTSSSGTHTFGSSATNLVADFVSTDGTAAIRLKDNGGNVELSTASGNFQVQPAGGSPVFTVASSGGVTSTGLFTNTYGNGNISAPSTSNHASGTRQVYYNSSATAWYARGIEANTLWDNVDQDWKLYRQGSVRLHWNEANDSFNINGVREYRKAIYLTNNVAYTFDIDVKSIGSSGQILEVFAGYTHYSTTYGAVIKQIWSQRSSGQSDVVIINNTVSHSTSQGGAWSFTYVDADTVRLTKSAGTYGGGGHGYIAIRGSVV